MRIAILQGAFLPIPTLLGGAVEKMWFALGKEFAKMGHEVIQISRSYPGLPQTEIIDGVYHYRVKGYPQPSSTVVLKWLDLLYSLRVRTLLQGDLDIVVTNTFWAPLVLPIRIKSVCMVDVARMPKGQMPLYVGVARLRANSTSVAEAIFQELSPNYHEKVVTIPNPLPFSPPLSVDIRAKQPTILYVGRIHPEKGLDILIQAYRQTAQTYKLQLVGPWSIGAGGGGENYINYLKELAADCSVEFVGPVFDEFRLNQYYQQALIFAYPSVAEQGETFGLAPLEAMAWGCVPVVSNLGCFKDFITAGRNGMVFDHRAKNNVECLAEQLRILQTNNELRYTLAKNALMVCKTHSTSQIARLFIEEFVTILEQKDEPTYR